MINGQNNSKENPPILEGLTSSMYNHLNTQESLIDQIENKLHLILNRGLPKDSSSGNKKDTPSDFSARISEELSRLDVNNSRLEGILKHVSEII